MKKDYQKTASDFETEAQRGDARALLRLSTMVEAGWRGAEADPQRAQELVRRAAELGHAGAACRVGDAHFRGRGVPKDAAEAMRWYRRAAEGGDVDAMANLLGDLKSEDAAKQAESLRWLERAALAGQPHALHVASGRPPGSLEAFAAQSLEEIARLAVDQPDEFAPTFELQATSAQMNRLLGEFVHACQRTWPDVTWRAELSGDEVDVPSPEPHESLDDADLELTFYPGPRHLQLNFYRTDDDWELVFASFEPHPTESEQATLIAALHEAARATGVVLKTPD